MHTMEFRYNKDAPDFNLSYRGSVSVLTPLSPQAEAWLDENIIVEDTSSFCRGIVIEHTALLNLVRAIDAFGLVVDRDWPESKPEFTQGQIDELRGLFLGERARP